MELPDHHDEEVERTANSLALTLNISNEDGVFLEEGEEFILAGKLLSTWPASAKRIHELFSVVWKCNKSWVVKELKPGLYQFRFRDKEDMEKIIARRPWTFKGSQMIFNPWPSYLTIKEITFEMSQFEVRFGGFRQDIYRRNMLSEWLIWWELFLNTWVKLIMNSA